MQIHKRIEKLEDRLLVSGHWNLTNVSTDSLIEIRKLFGIDPARARSILQKYIDKGIVTYEYQNPH